MELTLNNLVIFFETEYSELGDEKPNINTHIRNDFFSCIDGDDAIEMLHSLEKTFNVDFHSFDFTKYFHEEIEISRSLINFGIIKLRKINEELTIQMLYNYMIKSKNK